MDQTDFVGIAAALLPLWLFAGGKRLEAFALLGLMFLVVDAKYRVLFLLESYYPNLAFVFTAVRPLIDSSHEFPVFNFDVRSNFWHVGSVDGGTRALSLFSCDGHVAQIPLFSRLAGANRVSSHIVCQSCFREIKNPIRSKEVEVFVARPFCRLCVGAS